MTQLVDRKKQLAISIVKTLRQKGYEAYLVGGCVRDMVMRKPPKDYDVATSARPEDVQRLFAKTIPVGAQFGVMLVLLDGRPFEVATFRTDEGYADGRHPTGVRFSSAKEDVLRRDFTVNGLFYDPITKQVIDYVDGRKDIKRKLIRTIGDPLKRFEEDKLRMIRAVRFAVNLGFHIDPATVKAIHRLKGQITQVSFERIRDELVKMFTGQAPGQALERLDETSLLAEVLPEVARMRGVEQPPQFHPEGDVFVHTRLLLDQLKRPTVIEAMAALLHDVGKPDTFKRGPDRIRFDGHAELGARIAERIMRRLRFANDEIEAVVACVEGHMRFKDVKQMRESTLKRFMRRPTFQAELVLHRVDCLASHGDLSNYRFLKRQLKAFSEVELRPPPLVTGHDLLAMGFPQGPIIGEILKAIEERQLEHQLTTKQDALHWITQQYGKLDHRP